MTLEQVYKDYGQSTPAGERARSLLLQTHWFSTLADFDPRSSEALPKALSACLRKISSYSSGILKDRLWRIMDHARPSMERLFYHLNEEPHREHAILPLRAVRELDTASFMALSRRPGRTIREKLSARPYLQAVQHFQSVDLPENQLLKAFSQRLVELLELRVTCLWDMDSEALLEEIRSWLMTDKARSIRPWENLPPNNTLLTHRDYRAIYDSWRWLQSLDEDISRDMEHLEERELLMEQWIDYGNKACSGFVLVAEEPVFFDYDEFEIQTWDEKPPHMQEIKGYLQSDDISVTPCVPVCVDLTEVLPHYACVDASAQKGYSTSYVLSRPFLWQRWAKGGMMNITEDLDLCDSNAVYLHPDAVTLTASDLFKGNQVDDTLKEYAAKAFAKRLGESFRHSTLIWLIPDASNDFELEIMRRNLNVYFPAAEPLPRSVAAVFEKIDCSRLHRGYSVVVVDGLDGRLYATKLEARYDEKLKQCLPETHGFYWERYPTIILREEKDANKSAHKVAQRVHGIPNVDAQEQWHDASLPAKTSFLNESEVQHDKRIGKVDSIINIRQSPVQGGIKLYSLQKQVEDIPLWRDHIPELSIKVRKHGRYQRIYLVDRGRTVNPIRGKAVPIPIRETFTLPAGRPFYQFPLFIGEQEEAVGFSARVQSKAFPLKEDLNCRLNMTFTYGDNDSYHLVFEPIDASVKPIQVHWRRTEEIIITDAPAPVYPSPMTWEQLQKFPKQNSDETQNLLEWVLASSHRLKWMIQALDKQNGRMCGKIISEWRENKRGLHYTWVAVEKLEHEVFIHEKDFEANESYQKYTIGDVLSFEVIKQDMERYKGIRIAREYYHEKRNEEEIKQDKINEIIIEIRKSLYFPVIQVWGDGRSMSDSQCPSNFKIKMDENILYIEKLLAQETIPQKIKRELFFLLSCMHKDTSPLCINWLNKKVEGKTILYQRNIGFSLSDLSQDWQKTIFYHLTKPPITDDAIRVFAYAIWRNKDFVNHFNIAELKHIFTSLLNMLSHIQPFVSERNNRVNDMNRRQWARSIAEPLELLLGLLRTRASSSSDIKMLLQPHQKITKDLARQVERVSDILANKQMQLFSRVQLGHLPPKPEEDRTPDLLYALRLYLTGDDGANAIEITGVSDEDVD